MLSGETWTVPKTTIFGDCKHFFKNAYNLIGLRGTQKLAVDEASRYLIKNFFFSMQIIIGFHSECLSNC